MRWIVSYDNVPEISSLYKGCFQKEYELVHSSNKSKLGKEILFFSPDVVRPELDNWDPLKFKLRRKENSNYLVYDQGLVIEGIRFIRASQTRFIS